MRRLELISFADYLTTLISYLFSVGDLRLLIETITRGRYQPVPNVFSNHLSELIKVMLRPDPSRRVSAEQVGLQWRRVTRQDK